MSTPGTIPLLGSFEGVVCDLDGVVYHGPVAVPGAVEALRRLQQVVPVLFATNNASRTPQDVARHLEDLGIQATSEDVLTSSTVGAAVLADELECAASVLAVGGVGVSAALRDAGLTPVSSSECGDRLPGAVLQGYGPDVTASDLATASFAVAAGARWIATNTDLTLPTDRGPAPGNGTLVAAVRAATGREPETVGKPGPLMYAQAADRIGASVESVLGVGDRLETDIAGAKAAGMRSALVLTGVHGPRDLAVAPASLRPDHVLNDLTDLLMPYESVTDAGDGTFECGRARARWSGAQLETHGSGIELLRAGLAVVWQGLDDGFIDRDQAGSSVGPLSRDHLGADIA